LDDDLVECSICHEVLAVHIALVFQCDPVYQRKFGEDSQKHSYKYYTGNDLCSKQQPSAIRYQMQWTALPLI